MIRFENDYAEGCIDEILEKLVATNYEQTAGYRVDDYCKSAAKKYKIIAIKMLMFIFL